MTECYGDLGCFTADDFVFGIFPRSPKEINTLFQLYTRANKDKPQLLKTGNKASLKESNFNHGRETKIMVHGFLDKNFFSISWMEELKDEFLIQGDYNVIAVDWGNKGANGFPFSLAASNARIVGAETALLIKSLQVIIHLS